MYNELRMIIDIGRSSHAILLMTDPDSGLAGKARCPREPRADEVTAQMEKILASADFAQSVRLQNFLRFIVEETLSGRGADLKEYTIALDVFERDESFDPQTSSIVRVEASRLRAKLLEHWLQNQRTQQMATSVPNHPFRLALEKAYREERDQA